MLKIKNNLYNKKLYWTTKKWLNEKPIFIFWLQIFRVDYNWNKSKDSARLLWHALCPFVLTVIYSFFIVVIFEIYNYVWPVNAQFLSSGSINSFLAAIASVSGLFLGLYFAAVSGIASNFLLQSTQNIRRYFLSAPVGKQYVQTVALTGIVSIFYLVAESFGYSVHPIGLVFLALLGAYIIIRFWTVGSEVFYSLEPISFLPYISKSIFDYIKSVTPPGYKWNKPAIQNHYRRLVADNLELVADFNDFGIKKIKLSDEQLIIALRYLGGLLCVYADHKRKIPTNSFWYKTKNQFESWTLADSTNISIALQTGTTLLPKTVKDFTWFEEQILDISLNILKFFAKEKKLDSTFQGLEVFVDAAEIYAKDFDVNSVKLLFEKLDTITLLIYSIKIDGEKRAHKEHLAFVDTQGRLAISALLGFSKFLEDQTVVGLIEKISKIKWIQTQGVYLADLPFGMLPNLESIANDLRNELVIEGTLQSPAWYIETLCVHSYIFALQRYFDFIKSSHSEFFQSKFDKLIEEGQLPLAIHLLQRWIEFTNKYQRMVYVLKKHVDECTPFHKVKDLSWPVFDFDVEEKIATNREKEVVDKFVHLLPKLNELAGGDDLPDYFGQALALGIEACYQACEENDPDRLNKILPIVFDASLTAFDKIRAKVQNWAQEDVKIVYSTESLINLLEISGYARLYSELYQNPILWKVTQTLWDDYLGAIDAHQFIQFLNTMVRYRDNLFMIMPQDNLRTGWKMSFENKLREYGFPIFPDSESYNFLNNRQQPVHESALIRIIIMWGGLMIMSSIEEIFFATYLSSHAGASGIELPDRHDLRERLKKESQGANDD